MFGFQCVLVISPRRDDLAGKSFQIGCFGKGDEDGMVGALGVLGDEAEGLLGIHGGVGEVFEEKLSGCVVGSAEGGE